MEFRAEGNWGAGWAAVNARAYGPGTGGSVYKLGGVETGGGGTLSKAWHLHAWLQKGPSKAGQGRCSFPIWNLAGSSAPAPLPPFRRLTLLTGLHSPPPLTNVQPLATFPIPQALAGTLRSLSKNPRPGSGSRHKRRASCCFPGRAGLPLSLPLLQGGGCHATPPQAMSRKTGWGGGGRQMAPSSGAHQGGKGEQAFGWGDPGGSLPAWPTGDSANPLPDD